LAEQLDTSIRSGLPQGVDEFGNKAMTPQEKDTPQIQACKVESHAAERAWLHSHDLGHFYELAPHIAAALDRSDSTTSDQIR
jgi:hypothetical protein